MKVEASSFKTTADLLIVGFFFHEIINSLIYLMEVTYYIDYFAKKRISISRYYNEYFNLHFVNRLLEDEKKYIEKKIERERMVCHDRNRGNCHKGG